ncbi:MAG: hypothetical protein J2P30_12145 [Actinobacteria bacterium]|nr:hypothetical protein [Actinomycetota bacterium]
MLEADSTEVRSGTRAAHLEIARRTSLGMGIGVVVQYALGMWVNLYVTVPARDQGGGFLAAIGRALANGPVALGLHAGLGLVLVLGSISLVVRSVLSRNRALIVLSALFLLAVLGAASSGASFVDSGHDSESASMAMLAGVALICSLLSLYVLGSARGAAQREGPVSPR